MPRLTFAPSGGGGTSELDWGLLAFPALVLETIGAAWCDQAIDPLSCETDFAPKGSVPFVTSGGSLSHTVIDNDINILPTGGGYWALALMVLVGSVAALRLRQRTL